MEMAKKKYKLEASARLFAEWALVRLVYRYEPNMKAVRATTCHDRFQFAHGYTPQSEAKVYILQTIYTTEGEKGKNRTRFDNLR